MALLHHVMRMFSGPLHFILYWRSDVTIQQSTVGSLQRSANMIKCDKKKEEAKFSYVVICNMMRENE